MSRNRRRTILFAAGAIAAAPGFAVAQQAGRMHRLGVLSIGTDPARAQRWQPLFDALRELGYTEGHNLGVTRGFGDGKADRLPAMVGTLLEPRVDVIVTTGDREVLALKRAGAAMPIVFTFIPDPVGSGFVASLARPGGNITGFSSVVPALRQKYVELLRETVPAARRFALVATASNTRAEFAQVYEAAAKALGMSMLIATVTDRNSYDGVLAQAKANGAEGIIAPMDGETFRFRADLARLAGAYRLPAIYGDVGYVEAGGLMSYSSSFGHRLQRAATYVDRILKGAQPADLPVEQPSKFEFAVNLKTAKALGIRIPQTILLRADTVFE